MLQSKSKNMDLPVEFEGIKGISSSPREVVRDQADKTSPKIQKSYHEKYYLLSFNSIKHSW